MSIFRVYTFENSFLYVTMKVELRNQLIYNIHHYMYVVHRSVFLERFSTASQ